MTGRFVVILLCACTGLGLSFVLFTSSKVHTVQPDFVVAKEFESVEPVPSAMEVNPAPIVSSDGVARMSADSKPDELLQREVAREPLSALAAPRSPGPPPDPATLPRRWRLVHRTVATAAGILDSDGMTMVLPGIDVVSTDETCLAPDGVGWPCGMAARTAFRAYLRGRSINCRLPDVPSEKSMLTDCLLQGEDPALWLVKNGWARAKSDSQFLSEGQIAKEATRGIFGYPQR